MIVGRRGVNRMDIVIKDIEVIVIDHKNTIIAEIIIILTEGEVIMVVDIAGVGPNQIMTKKD